MRRFGTQWKEMQTVARYILQRLGQTLLILLIVSFITYLLIDFLPGDPIAAMLGGEISQETYDWWYQELNLDKPVLIRYVLWLILFPIKNAPNPLPTSNTDDCIF